MAKKITLPTVLRETTWFFEKNKEVLKEHVGKPYISYSSVNSYFSYFEDFIKQKFAGKEIPGTVYTRLGNFFGEAMENGFWAKENPDGFEGMELIDFKEHRPENAEYEKFICIDFGDFIFIGFIDRFLETPVGCEVTDFKTGAANKMVDYTKEDYTQVVLYARALELSGKKVSKTGVQFFERIGSHKNPPLKLSGKNEYIPLDYSEERIKFAESKVREATEAISELYITYLKVFGNA